MEYPTFAEALDFAIGREKAAVAFYDELLSLASFAAQKSTLAEFRAMEEGHVTKLGNMKLGGKLKLSAKIAVDLGLAQGLSPAEPPAAAMTYQDILVSAIKKEERSGALYANLAASSPDAEIRDTFSLLAVEEGRHKRYFEELYDSDVARDN